MEFLKNHKVICDNILSKLDKKIQVSQDSMEKIQKYFGEIKDIELTYSKSMLENKVQLMTCFRDLVPMEKTEKGQQTQQF